MPVNIEVNFPTTQLSKHIFLRHRSKQVRLPWLTLTQCARSWKPTLNTSVFWSFDHNKFRALRYCFKKLKEKTKKNTKKKTKNIINVFSEAQRQALSKIAEQTEQRKTREIMLAKEHFIEFMSDILTTNPAAVKTSS